MKHVRDRVLVYDDDEHLRTAACVLIRAAGFDARDCPDAESFLVTLAREDAIAAIVGFGIGVGYRDRIDIGRFLREDGRFEDLVLIGVSRDVGWIEPRPRRLRARQALRDRRPRRARARDDRDHAQPGRMDQPRRGGGRLARLAGVIASHLGNRDGRTTRRAPEANCVPASAAVFGCWPYVTNSVLATGPPVRP